MGNKISGETRFEYLLKTGQLISFIFYDLKGYEKFPPQPSQDIINKNFQSCLKQIKLEPQMSKLVLGLNFKYKHRFVVTHNNIVNSKFKKYRTFQDKILPVELNGIQNFELNLRLQKIEKCQHFLKTFLNELDKYLTQNQIYKEFMKENGYIRLALLLQRQQNKNNNLQNNFSNQIDILKLLNKLSKLKNSKIYYMASMQTLHNYLLILLSNFHPIHVAVSIPTLHLLQLCLWKSSQSQILTKLQQFQKQKNNSWILQPYVETINQSNNLYLIYSIIKFINSFIGSLQGEAYKKFIYQEFKKNDVNDIIDKIGQNIQQGKYDINHLSFDYIHQSMKEYKQKLSNLNYCSGMIKTVLRDIYKDNKTSTIYRRKTIIVQDLISQNQQNQQQKQQQQITYQNPYFLNSEQIRFQKLNQNCMKQIKRYFQLQQISQNQKYIAQNKHWKQLNQQFQILKIRSQELNNECILIETLKLCEGYDYTQWTELNKYSKNINNQYQKKKLDQIKKDKQQYTMLNQQLQNTNKIIKNLLKINNQLKQQTQTINRQIENTKKQNNQLEQVLTYKSSIRTTQTIDTHSQISLSHIQQTNQQSFQNIQNKPKSSNNVFESCLLPPLPPIVPEQLQSQLLLSPLILPQPPLLLTNFQLISDSNKFPVPPLLFNSQIKLNQQKIKSKCQPSKQMKLCLVVNIPYEKISNTIWSQIDDKKVNLDTNLLQSLFFKPDFSKKQNKQEVIELKKQKIRLIQKQRSKNIEIVLTKLRADYKALCQTLKSGFGKYSHPQLLNSLYKIIPTEDQQLMIKSFNGVVSQLAKPEQFFTQIIKIPEYKSRIKTLIFRSNYEQIIDQIQYKENALTLSFKKATENSRLHTILQTALALSNYLNGQTNRGGSWGFRIDSIENFQQVKSINGKDTLASVLIKQIWKKYQYPIFQQQEVQQFKLICSIPVNYLANQIRELKQNLYFAKKAFSSQIVQDQTDSIGLISSEIIKYVQQRIQQLDTLHDITYKNYINCAKFYCQNPNQSSEVLGKKLISCILFICRSQQTIHKQNQLIKKQQQRCAKTNIITFKQQYIEQAFKLKNQKNKNCDWSNMENMSQKGKKQKEIHFQNIRDVDYSNFITK